MTKQSGQALVRKYGKSYFKELRKKVKTSSLRASGRKGGLNFIKKYGKLELEKVAAIGRNKFKQRITTDKKFRELYRKSFIKKMKKFTKIHETKSGIKVRSKEEQKLANFLTTNEVKFKYESLSIPTKFGSYESDFVIGNLIIELLGMNTTFYLEKKLRKLKEAIKFAPNYKWVIFTTAKVTLKNCKIVRTFDELLTVIRNEGLLNP